MFLVQVLYMIKGHDDHISPFVRSTATELVVSLLLGLVTLHCEQLPEIPRATFYLEGFKTDLKCAVSRPTSGRQ